MEETPMDLPPEPQRMANRMNQNWRGIAFAHLFAFVIVAITRLLLHDDTNSDVAAIFVASEFFLVPFGMGLIAAWFWKRSLGIGKYFLWTFFSFMLTLVWAWMFLGEGYICLIIVSPLVYTCQIVGAFLGRLMFRYNNRTLNSSVFGILLTLYLFDVFSPHDYNAVVRDEIVINATPEEVWPNVVAFEPIETEPDYWLFEIKMPMPQETTVDGYYEGAGRKCIFNDGIVFDEIMTTFEPNENLTFEIIEQPEHPEIIGHIVMDKGQFLLQDNGDGTTTLVGTSWYRLLVFPTWYYDMWAESITREVHLRVMRHIKKLSEVPPADA